MNRPQRNDGFALVTLLVTIFLITMIGIATTQLVLTNFRLAKIQRGRVQAQFAADAAIDHALQSLNQDHNWTGVSETTLHEDDSMRTTYESEITDGDDSFKKFIYVTGRTYAPKTAPDPIAKRSYEIELHGVGGGAYSVVTGVGGLSLRNSAAILAGSVYVNGSLSLRDSSHIGLSILPVDVKVAHQSCPDPATPDYPRVCGPGENGEPINIQGYSRIYGEVQARNQTNGSRMGSPGLVSGSPAAIELPEYDREAHKAAVAHTMSASSANCPLLGLGVKNWPANTKINGNLTIGPLCVVNVNGPIWVTGNLVLNGGTMNVGLGVTEPPVIMVDGNNGFEMRNAAIMLPNVLGLVGFRVITFASTAACSPDCANVTGTDLYNSKDKTTINIRDLAIAAESEFYARWSKVQVSTTGNIGAVVGQQIDLSSSVAITLGATVSGLDNPSAWVIRAYKRIFD